MKIAYCKVAMSIHNNTSISTNTTINSIDANQPQTSPSGISSQSAQTNISEVMASSISKTPTAINKKIIKNTVKTVRQDLGKIKQWIKGSRLKKALKKDPDVLKALVISNKALKNGIQKLNATERNQLKDAFSNLSEKEVGKFTKSVKILYGKNSNEFKNLSDFQNQVLDGPLTTLQRLRRDNAALDMFSGNEITSYKKMD